MTRPTVMNMLLSVFAPEGHPLYFISVIEVVE